MKRSRFFKIAAAVILGLTIIFWIVLTIIRMIEGNPSEANNLIILLGVFILALLAWRRPLLGGILLSAFGVILAMFFFLLPTTIQNVALYLLLMCAPVTVAGLLFIEADWTSKKRN